MGIIDITFIVILAIGFLFGIIGKFRNKLVDLLLTIVALIVAYVVYDTAIETIKGFDVNGQTVLELYNSSIAGVVSGLGVSAEALEPISIGLFNVVAFWALAIVSMLAFMVVGWIVKGILKLAHGKEKDNKSLPAIASLGIFGTLNFVIVMAVMVLPLIVLTPLLKDTSALNSLLGGTETSDSGEPSATAFAVEDGEDPAAGSFDFGPILEVLNTISEEINNSSVMGKVDYILTAEKEDGSKLIELKFMEVTVTDEDGNVVEYNFYNELNSVSKAITAGSKLLELMNGDIMENIKKLTDDDIREIVADMSDSTVVLEVINGFLSQYGYELDLTSVDFTLEADTFIQIRNIVVAEKLEDVDFNKAADTFCKSKLVMVVAKSQEGALADIDQEYKDAVIEVLDQKLGEGKLAQEDYNTLLKLFSKKNAQ